MKNTTKKKLKKTAILASMILGALTLNNCKVEVTPGNTNNDNSENNNYENTMKCIVGGVRYDSNNDGVYDTELYLFTNDIAENIGEEFTDKIYSVCSYWDDNDMNFITTAKNSNNQIETRLNANRQELEYAEWTAEGDNVNTQNSGLSYNPRITDFLQGLYDVKLQKARYKNVTRIDLPLVDDYDIGYLSNSGEKEFYARILNDKSIEKKDCKNFEFVKVLGVNDIDFHPIRSKIKAGTKENAEQYIKSNEFKKELNDYYDCVKEQEKILDETDNTAFDGKKVGISWVPSLEMHIELPVNQKYPPKLDGQNLNANTNDSFYNLYEKDGNAQIANDIKRFVKDSIQNRTFIHSFDTIDPNFNRVAPRSNASVVATQTTQKTR